MDEAMIHTYKRVKGGDGPRLDDRHPSPRRPEDPLLLSPVAGVAL